MTGDELAAALYVEQGYLIVGTTYPVDIGCVIRENTCESTREPARTPLRVLSLASHAEYRAQCVLYIQMGGRVFPDNAFGWPYVYRVEACD